MDNIHLILIFISISYPLFISINHPLTIVYIHYIYISSIAIVYPSPPSIFRGSLAPSAIRWSAAARPCCGRICGASMRPSVGRRPRLARRWLVQKWWFNHQNWWFNHQKRWFNHQKWWFRHQKWWFRHQKWWFRHQKWWFMMILSIKHDD